MDMSKSQLRMEAVQSCRLGLVLLMLILLALQWLCWVNDNDYKEHVQQRPVSLSIFIRDSTVTKRSLNDPHWFPSPEQRLQVYMANWYLPPHSSPCWNQYQPLPMFSFEWLTDEDNFQDTLYASPLSNRTRVQISSSDDQLSVLEFDRFLRENKAFVVEQGTIEGCSKCYDENPFLRPTPGVLNYCKDVQKTLLPLLISDVPFVFQFGCTPQSRAHGVIDLPHFRKFRYALKPSEIQQIVSLPKDSYSYSTIEDCPPVFRPERKPHPNENYKLHPQPLLWLLNSPRFRFAVKGVKHNDVPWKQKRNAAVWRGALTGSGHYKLTQNHTVQNCLSVARCRFVYEMEMHTIRNRQLRESNILVDAKLTSLGPQVETGLNNTKTSLNGIALVGNTMTQQELLKYKILIVLEGHEISSGLLWSLYSNSVVLMAPPHYTSWSMEELLVPWVHYVPLSANLRYDNVQEQIEWILSHEEEAQQIVKAASLWVHNLMFRPEAEAEDNWIRREMVERYQAYFLDTKKSSKA